MAIVKMKRLRLAGLSCQREELLRELQQLGCVEVSEPEERPEDEAWAALVRAEDCALQSNRDRAERLNGALDTLNKHVKEKRGLLTPLPQVAEAELYSSETAEAAAAAAEAVTAAEERMEAARAELGRLKGQRRALEPWAPLDVPLDVKNTRSAVYLFGGIAARWDPEAVEAGLAEVTGLCQLCWAGRDGDQRCLLAICHAQAERGVLEYLKEFGFARASLKEWSGTAAANLAAIDGAIAGLEKELAAAGEELAAQAERRQALELSIDRVRQDIAREDAAGRLMASERAFFLEGWFPASEEARVAETLDRVGCAWECADPTEEEYPDVPVRLKNNPITEPFNVITETYSLPAYGSVDPNPLMAPFFIAFFGFMMNDIGYGLLMMLGTAVYLKMARPRGGTRNMMTMFFLCGISSIFWGCLTGSFFGDFLPKLFQLTGVADDFVWFWPPLFTPVNDIIMVMVGSMVLGVIQVFVGMAVSVVEKFRHGEVLDAVTQEIAWYLILGGAAVAIAGPMLGGAALGTVGVVLLIAGFGLLLAGNLIRAKGLGGLMGFGGDLYNGISGYFSDILSYLRLMALMMAGSIIASVFNTLGSVFGLVPFIIVSLIGNILNLVLNLLGCYVHTMRLQCLEFFGRFYKDGGKPFRPLAVETQYVDILKEEM